MLVVEDNPEVAEVTRELAGAEQGCTVVTVAGNAEAALRRSDEGEFDVVLSDIVMAGAQNGLDLARIDPGATIQILAGHPRNRLQ